MARKTENILRRFKPGGSVSTQLLLAALLWSIVGCCLVLSGTLWLLTADAIWFLLPAVLFGTIKSFFILDKSVKKSIDRIQLRADGSCLGGVYSFKTWLLVIGMIIFGFVLRKLPIPLEFLGFLYSGVGWSLLLSSRSGWKSWALNRHQEFI